MASDMGGMPAPTRFAGRVAKSFPQAPDSVATRDMAGYAAYTQDPYHDKVALLLHGDGANGDTVTTDYSPANSSITFNGAASISTAQNRFGGSSFFFDGSTSYLSTPISSNYDLSTNSDATLEILAYSTVATLQMLMSTRNSSTGYGWHLYFSSSGTIVFEAYSSYIESPAVVVYNQWKSVVLVKRNGVFTVFYDGAPVVSGSVTVVYDSGQSVYIGRQSGTGYYFNGYMDEIRYTYGIARYGANFTPPTRAFPDF